MKIIKYKKVSGNKYEITLENNEKIKLYEDVILKEELLLKKEIRNLNKVLEINKEYEIYEVALNYLNHHVLSKKGMNEYLLKKKYPQENVEKIMKLLINKGYLDDVYYAKCYINDHARLSNDGPLKIKKHLLDNGIDEDIFNDILLNYDNIWKEKIERYLKKQTSLNKKSIYYFKNKMMVNLINLGYEREMINEALSKIKIDNQEELKEKEEMKIRKKLERKYTGEELERRIKEKLYGMGFF